MSLKKNLLKNGLATVFQKLIRVFEQLALVPFFISAWGAAYYGEWLTLTIFPTIIGLSDLGIGSAAANTFVLRYGAKDYQGAANVYRSGRRLISTSILVSILLGGIVIGLLDYYGVFAKTLIVRSDAILAVSFLMLAKLLDFFQQLYEAHFRAARHAARSINLLSIYALLKIVGSILALTLGGGIVSVAVVTFGIAIVFNAYFGWQATVQLKTDENYISKGYLVKSDMTMVAKKGFGYLLSPIWQSVYFQGTTFVVRITLGPEAVALFNTIRTVCRSVNQLFNMVNGTVFPELQYELSIGRLHIARLLFRRSLSLVLGTAVLGMLLLGLFGAQWYAWWTKHTLDPPPLMWQIFIIGIGFNALWWTASMVFRAVNKPYVLVLAGLAGSVISVGLSYFLCLSHGLVGAALGSLALEIIMVAVVLPVSCRYLGQYVWQLPKGIWSDSAVFFKKIGKISK